MATRLSQWNKAAPALIEHRGAIRYGVGVSRHDHPEASLALATMHDVSTYGCRLALADTIEIGERLTITIGAAAPLDATTIWAEDGMIGCRFAKPLPRALSRALTLGIHPVA
ncbi:hypothetical protein GGQ80_002584 [Sphingomonas jinjuensis]|uniref:PilZ domain-containing protein n=1 Tax=Sphingomonas jinjuensis TaxID=535907 RepID=A0A840FL66_9SPHN|nr:PilZ domain-containing protein [Sphingomonas jinjuensis]MBB4154668.1 hypothetical protein [Sphingomonas jinjuensis]